MNGAGDFFVKQRITDGAVDKRIETEGKFAGITGAGIGVEYLLQIVGIVVGAGLNGFSVAESQRNAGKHPSVLRANGVEFDFAVYRIDNRCAVDFAVGNVPQTVTGRNRNVFD